MNMPSFYKFNPFCIKEQTMKTVKEIQGTIAQKQSELAELFQKHTNASGQLDMTAAQVEEARTRNNELTALGKELDDVKSLDEIYQKNQEYRRNDLRSASDLPMGGASASQSGGQKNSGKTLGQLVTESEAFKAYQPGRDMNVSLKGLQMKTVMSTSAGYAPQSTRTGKEVDYAVRRPVVADLIPQTAHDQAAVKYMEETTFTNSADTVAEEGSIPESANAWTERTEAMWKISTFLPVTDEQMKYVPQVNALIDNRLTLFLKLAEETKLLTGGGTTDLTGFLVKSGVQSQAKGSDPTPDALYKAITKVRATGFAEPTAFVMHPNDWQDIRLLRTTDGIYIWGSPAEAGPERVWSLPGVITTAETENTALLGDFQLYAEIFRGSGVDIKVSDSHSDYFVKGKMAIKATEYVTLAIYRAAAFCKITGI
jgi:HK97 family phage major capsid protein